MKNRFAIPALLMLGLAFLDVWCDLLGHGQAMVPAADTVQKAFMNGRVVWNAALVVFCGFIVLRPNALARRRSALDGGAAVVTALFTIIYACAPSWMQDGMLPIACIAVTGMCYGWLEIRLLCGVAYIADTSLVVMALVLSRVLKSLMVALFGTIDDVALIAIDACAALACGAFLIAAEHARGTVASTRAPSSWSLPQADRSFFIMFLVLYPVLNAVSRALSPLGFWGDTTIVGAEGFMRALPAAFVFCAVAMLVFWKPDTQAMFRRMAAALLILLGMLIMVDGDMFASTGIPQNLLDSAKLSVELLSHFLFWLAAVMAVRTLNWPMMRSAAMAELVMSFSAIVLSTMLQAVSGVERVAITGVLYGIVAGLVVRIWRLREQTEIQLRNMDEACEAIACKNGLTPRETEVLKLLAEGRSRPYIMEKLVVSDATVKSHTSHIYRKLGVSGKQELIALVRGE